MKIPIWLVSVWTMMALYYLLQIGAATIAALREKWYLRRG